MSVSEAARQLGVGRPALSNLLNGNANLSRDMALKLERIFGADANALIRRQAEQEERDAEPSAPQLSSGFFKITSSDIDQWASTIPARTTLPVLLRRLIHTSSAARVDFPGHDAGERRGWDGFSEAGEASPWVPIGKTGWELSVSADLPGKANRDIQARSKLPAAEKAQTTYVFATARNWPGKSDWAARQRALGEWRDVRAYDAADLEQWLEQSPLTQIWLMGELGRSTDGVQPASTFWRDWSQSTSPALSPRLFEEAIAAHRQTLVNWLGTEAEHPFVIVADSVGEALTFVALALRNEQGTEGTLADEAVVANSPDALLHVSASSRSAILIVGDRATEIAASCLTRRNRIIVARPRTSVENDPDISLEAPSSEAFRKALAEMEVDEDRHDQLIDESGLSPTILRRRLATVPELRLPEWAADKALLRKLLPMLLAGAWSRTVEADRMLVEELAGRPFDTVELDLINLLGLPDTPVWAIGNYRGIVSRKDALFVTGGALTQEDVDRFFQVAEYILSEDDPALDLAPEDRWKANIYDKKREISGAMRSAVGEFLVLLAVYGARLLGPHLDPVDIRVDALVSKLLRNVASRRWLSQQGDLPLLAEAAPRAFLEAVEADLRSNEPQLLAMLRPVASGPFDSPDRSGLLWALETIAWDPNHFFRVARVLARLSEVPINDNWSNKPEASLESLIRSWLPQTAAPIAQRLKLLDILAREFPAVGWQVCKAQVDTGQRFASPNSRPRWRTDAAGAGAATYQEDFETRRYALDLMLAWPWLDMEQLGDLIAISAELMTEDQIRVWEHVQQWIEGGPSDDDCAALRERMRRSVLARRNRKKVRPAKVDKLRRAVFEALAPTNPIDRHRWLFAENWVSESGDDIFDDDFDYDKHEAHIQTLRRSALEEILASTGMAGVERLLSQVNAWGTIGHFLCEITPPAEWRDLIETLVARQRETGERYWIGCLQGALQTLGGDARDATLRALVQTMNDDDAILMLLQSAMFEQRTWAMLTDLAPHLEVAYWREVTPHAFRLSETELNIMVERLLSVDRPISAFNGLGHQYEKVNGTILARLMRALTQPTAEQSTDVQLHAGNISDALEALNAGGQASVAEMAQLEYLFINALTYSQHRIPNLERQIEEAPGDFVQLVSLLYKRDDGGEDPPGLRLPEGEKGQSVGENVYRALDMIKRTPGTREDGSVDPTALLDWMVDVRNRLSAVGRLNVGDSQIGQLLGRSTAGADSIWPNDAVRDALEACGSDRMLRGMEIGLLNNRGVMWRGPGGAQERTLAQKYRAYSRQLQAEYPVTARMLEMVAETYDGQAHWHDNDEAVRKRLRRR